MENLQTSQNFVLKCRLCKPRTRPHTDASMPCKHAPQQGSRDVTFAVATMRLCARVGAFARALACVREARKGNA